jgi:hypothetical protein
VHREQGKGHVQCKGHKEQSKGKQGHLFLAASAAPAPVTSATRGKGGQHQRRVITLLCQAQQTPHMLTCANAAPRQGQGARTVAILPKLSGKRGQLLYSSLCFSSATV